MSIRNLIASGAIASIGLAACQAPDLTNRFVVSDQSWNAAGIRLKAGDVVHLTTWVHGVPGTNGQLPHNSYPPVWGTERLPLRHASGSLYPLESAMLGSVLATHASRPLAVEINRALQRKEAALWNALVPSLLLAKVNSDKPMQLQIDQGRFCSIFARNNSGGDRDLILQTLFDWNGHECAESAQTELRQIGQLDTALAPLTEIQGNLNGGFYGASIKYVAVARVEVEVNGVWLRNHDGLESRWSLAEWEAAHICRDGAGSPLAITFVELGQLFVRGLHVVERDEPAEIEIVPDARRGRTVRQDDSQRGAGTISRASLRLLYPADAIHLTWGADQWALDPKLQPSCMPG
jgi:hypothetical protein